MSKNAVPEVNHPLTVSRPELLDESGDRHFRSMLHDMLAISTRLEVVRAGFGKMIGLTGVEYTMIIAILHLSESGDVYVNTLADHLHLSGAFVTIQTNKLAAKGLLKKAKDTRDARKVKLLTTKKARGLLDKIASTQRQVNDVMFENLSKKEFQALSGQIAALLDNSDRVVALVNYLSQSPPAE